MFSQHQANVDFVFQVKLILCATEVRQLQAAVCEWRIRKQALQASGYFWCIPICT